jgi:5-methylcytosine-specific restriction endonuclease McrA
MMKPCTRCDQVKRFDEFPKDSRMRDGRLNQCRTCRSTAVTEQRNRSPDVRARHNSGQRKRWADGSVARMEASIEARLGPEGYENRTKRRRVQNRINAARHQAVRMGAQVNDLTIEDWDRLVVEHGGCCAYCGTAAELVTEHVVPLSRGGDNTKDNVVPACSPCNRRKSRRSGDQFRHGLCEAGHVRTGANVYIYPDGRKTACKPCRRIAQANARARKASN